MTDDEIDTLQALCDLATPGPWFAEEHKCECCAYVTNEKGVSQTNVMYVVNGKAASWHENARFIAEARTALPALLDEVQRLKATLASIEEYGTAEINAAVDLREEVARLRQGHLTEAMGRVTNAILGTLEHMQVEPHCDWLGHPVEQVVGTEVAALQAEVEGLRAFRDRVSYLVVESDTEPDGAYHALHRELNKGEDNA